MEQEIEIDGNSSGLREVYRKRVWERHQKAMKLLMKKNKTEWEKYQRRDAWTRCQVTTL